MFCVQFFSRFFLCFLVLVSSAKGATDSASFACILARGGSVLRAFFSEIVTHHFRRIAQKVAVAANTTPWACIVRRRRAGLLSLPKPVYALLFAVAHLIGFSVGSLAPRRPNLAQRKPFAFCGSTTVVNHSARAFVCRTPTDATTPCALVKPARGEQSLP